MENTLVSMGVFIVFGKTEIKIMRDLCVIFSREDVLSPKPNMYYAGNYRTWKEDISDAEFLSPAGAQRLLSKWKDMNFNINKNGKEKIDLLNYEIIEVYIFEGKSIPIMDNSMKKEQARIRKELKQKEEQKKELRKQIESLERQAGILERQLNT